ncbi:hypothetical protein SCOCK_70162 [Actinacidiphila cocklensis]|uniref:Uncharacterized protein n=1 Tax=Actinacidiphila cocklensis TaxID=887465 RepID=A0A9W4DYS6_9ACTN|nr:hypothetical protein SCOCK_70162 [Actinacidiphila cocklensis]
MLRRPPGGRIGALPDDADEPCGIAVPRLGAPGRLRTVGGNQARTAAVRRPGARSRLRPQNCRLMRDRRLADMETVSSAGAGTVYFYLYDQGGRSGCVDLRMQCVGQGLRAWFVVCIEQFALRAGERP